MTTRLSRWLFCALVGTAVAAEKTDSVVAKRSAGGTGVVTPPTLYGEVSGHDRTMLLIPLEPVEQKISPRMQRVMEALAASSALEKLPTWTSRRELPKWAYVRAGAEIVYVPPRPSVSDDFRYGVILGSNDRVVVVRAGGISGSYDVFERPTRGFLWFRGKSPTAKSTGQ